MAHTKTCKHALAVCCSGKAKWKRPHKCVLCAYKLPALCRARKRSKNKEEHGRCKHFKV